MISSSGSVAWLKSAWRVSSTSKVNQKVLPIPNTECAELELRWAGAEGWFVQGGIGYIDSEITDDGNLLSVANGAPLSNAPEWSINGLVVKDTPVGDNNLRLQTNFQWQDEYNSSL